MNVDMKIFIVKDKNFVVHSRNSVTKGCSTGGTVTWFHPKANRPLCQTWHPPDVDIVVDPSGWKFKSVICNREKLSKPWNNGCAYVNLVWYYIRLRIQPFLLAPRRQGRFLLAMRRHLAARSYEATISNPWCSVKKWPKTIVKFQVWQRMSEKTLS